ncbi:hypothetical protein [Gordonia tangerina]|uniref:Uncharacterized protein n=1 Tax=Gordonia tangerina TaxID=2911060 RepID=A0ABS9DCQ2_9ACTN|nr:hypothetical protein [Gordonia tangerina]MCF3936987.1 hypothetical protein [Gordonia tangerina]
MSELAEEKTHGADVHTSSMGVDHELASASRRGLVCCSSLAIALIIAVLIVWAMVTYLTQNAVVLPDVCPSGSPW